MAYVQEDLGLRIEAFVHVDSTKTFTTVTLVAETDGGVEWAGIGTSKRNAGDEYNEDIGLTLATARAFRDLAEAMEDAAHALDS